MRARFEENREATVESVLPRFFEEMARLSGNLLLLRAHLYLEESVNFALDNIFPNYDAIKQKRPRYELKLALLEATGANSEFLSPYRKLGKMRNKLAHELDYEFGDREIREFLASFQGVQRKTLNRRWFLTRHSTAVCWRTRTDFDLR